MNLNEALNKLFSLHQFGVKLGLDNIRKLLNFLGNPERKINTFHIAGSNGKGSTASFISSILMESGKKTALYTSPHFVKYNERIRINGNMIDDDYVRDFMNDLDEFIDKNSPTFFELTTALAFKYFYENRVDYAVIETGLGGRLDATNTIDPIASVITSISYEHTNILGETLEKIAFEKSEILKPGGKSFIGCLPQEAAIIVREKSRIVSNELFELEKFLKKKSDYVKLNSNELHYNIYNTPLPGYHQLLNSALAVLTLNKTLGIKDVSDFNNGIQKVVKNTGIQGRYEKYHEKPDIIFDSAHNEEGIKVFIEEFKKNKHLYSKTSLIFGVMKDKNIRKMLNDLSENFNEIFLTTIDYERASGIDELKKISEELKLVTHTIEEPAKFIKKFKEETCENCLVVLGSMYLLGKIKEDLLK